MGQHVVIDLLEQFAVAEANARSVQLELMGDLAEQTALNARQAAELEALRTAHAATLARVTQLEAEAKIQHSSALGAQVAYAQVTEAQALHIKELNEHVKKLKADVTLSAALQTEADAVNAQQGRRLQELSENVQTLQVDLAVSKAKHVQTEARYRSEATKDAVKIKALQVKIIQQRKSADDDFLKDKRQTAKIEELKVELDVIKNKAMAREAKLVTELAGKRARDAEVKKSSEVMDADVNAGPSNTTPPRCVCAMRSHRFQPVLLVDPKSTFAQASVAYPSAFTHDSRRIVQRGGDKFEAPLLLPAWPVERKREEFAESAAKRRKAF
ncbi:hypothetical protein FB45DRAFT_921588 [Roridomyces roridus]|uniref:Uncharacterized protein n=1 Tax=Roridomyces roridus TaxID=1738132 RepID=A0AAD7FI64_9AGAR|nr:hypothetical protein FB45DRAFT_921588 [Roridomyces roridus]